MDTLTDFEVTGRIFDIQRYSIHDGPGIRTIVFFKGCPLRCRWCCNPESQNPALETRHMDGKDVPVGEDVTVAQVMETVEKDRPYYSRSGGGLTLSGGECLFQPDFAQALLRAARDTGINTAIESTACAPWEAIAPLLPHLDTCLLDIKHMDGEKHRAFIGRRNDLMLENAMRIAQDGRPKLIIRVPVVPTFNDTAEDIGAIARYAATLPGVEQLHLLPYHRLGQDKYGQLGRTYTLPDLRPPEPEQMEQLRRAAERASGLTCQIGG